MRRVKGLGVAAEVRENSLNDPGASMLPRG
jgi:hypothetical protein